MVATSCCFAAIMHVDAAQETPRPLDSRQQSKLLTMSGCVVADSTRSGRFSLFETDQAAQYRLTGADVRDYVGQRVEVSGTAPRRLRIVGGLYPSPNIAGQAGAIDPQKAAIAATEPSTSEKPLPEFRVRSVRVIPGLCPQR